jgi:hypothetical protein
MPLLAAHTAESLLNAYNRLSTNEQNRFKTMMGTAPARKVVAIPNAKPFQGTPKKLSGATGATGPAAAQKSAS